MSTVALSAFAHGRISAARLDRVLKHIENNLGHTILLQDLADVAALSRFHFSRAFKRTTGLSPTRFILERRVDAAKILLRNPDLQLMHIAYECGFCTDNHFCTSFKSVTGLTTCQYRQTL